MRRDCASRQAMACSRPPLPTTNKFNQHPRKLDEPDVALPRTLGRCRVAADAFNAELRAGFAPRTQSMPEVANAGENHGYAALVRGGRHFVVAHAAARLYDRMRTGVNHYFESVPKGKESVGRDHRAIQAQAGILRLNRSDARGIDAAHLPGAYAQRHAALAKDDGIGLHELRYAPCEQQVGELCRRGSKAGHHSKLGGVDVVHVGSLHQQTAADTFEIELVCAVLHRDFEDAQVGFGAELVERSNRYARCNHHFYELLENRLGCSGVQLTVESDDAAECRS